MNRPAASIGPTLLLAGCAAEEEWRKRNGRPMTAEELARVLRWYPGDG